MPTQDEPETPHPPTEGGGASAESSSGSGALPDLTESLHPTAGPAESRLPETELEETGVLDTHAALLGERPRIQLERTDPLPVHDLLPPGVASGPARPAGRRLVESRPFEVTGELGRGGMGLVLRARDADLGREVAIKLLHERYSRSPEALRRFIEEAQIGGQLQHPGIVQVYEMGLQSDRQPYFVMKLIKGQTFAHLLRGRKDVHTELAHMLGIFLDVCHAMAYAHERGVVHRDLKPANIMVGDHGAVQVADWGLAKIVGRPEQVVSEAESLPRRTRIFTTQHLESGTQHSTAGTIMGTLGYMPPEQARGEVDQVDQRSDVFALGSILCEILTGLPAQTGDREAALEAAQAGDQSEVLSRLASCELDPALIQLAADCLAPQRSSRPADAGEVARRLEEHLESLEKRAEAARIAAVEERVKAEGERRARRLVQALAGLVVVAILGSGAALWVSESRKRDRERAATDAVQEALADAGRLTRLAGTGATDLARWDLALEATRRAVALAKADVAAPLRQRSLELESEVEAARAAAAREIEEDRHYRQIFADLLKIREETARSDISPRKVLSRYQEIVSELGIDVFSYDAETAAQQIRGTRMARELTSIMDQAALLSIDMLGPGNPLLTGLVDMAERCDPDEWRTRLREAVLQGRTGELLDLSVDLDAAIPPATISLLGGALWQAGEEEEALVVFERGTLLHPDDFWLHLEVATLLLRTAGLEDPDSARRTSAAAHLRAATALRPDLVSPWNLLALAERGEVARMAFERARELDPDPSRLSAEMASKLLDEGDLERAVELLRRAAELQPEGVGNIVDLAVGVLRDGRVDQAIALLRLAIELDPTRPEGHHQLAAALRRKRAPLEEIVRAYESAIQADPQYWPSHAELVEALLRHGDAEAAYERLAQARAVVKDPPDLARMLASIGLAMVNSRQSESSVAILREALELDPGVKGASLSLSHGLRRTGDLAGSAEAARRAIALEDDVPLAHRLLGGALLGLGERARGLEEIQAGIDQDPRRAPALEDAGMILLEVKEYEEAERVLRESVQLDPTGEAAWVNLSATMIRRAQWDEATAVLEEATAAVTDSPQLFLNLAYCHFNSIRYAESLEALRRGHQLDGGKDWPGRPWSVMIRQAQDGLENVAALRALRDGEREIDDPREALRLAQLALMQGEHALALELFRRAEALDPDLFRDGQQSTRYNASCAALLVGGEEQRAQALGWLSAELEGLKSRLDSPGSAQARESLAHWLEDPDLASVRDPEALDDLPAGESDAWRALWQQVDALLGR